MDAKHWSHWPDFILTMNSLDFPKKTTSYSESRCTIFSQEKALKTYKDRENQQIKQTFYLSITFFRSVWENTEAEDSINQASVLPVSKQSVCFETGRMWFDTQSSHCKHCENSTHCLHSGYRVAQLFKCWYFLAVKDKYCIRLDYLATLWTDRQIDR